MINLIITIAGLLLVLGGLYSMTLGFATPPSIVMFLGGLIAFVVGAIIIVIFAGKINLGSKNKSEKPIKKEQKPSKKSSKKPSKKSVKKPVKPVESVGDVKKPVKPVESVGDVKKPVKPVESVGDVKKPVKKPVKPVESVGDVKKPVKPVESSKPVQTELSGEPVGEIKPKRARRTFKPKEPNKAVTPKSTTEKQSEANVSKGPTNLFSKLREKSKSSPSKNTVTTANATNAVSTSGSKKSKRPNPKRKIPNPKKRSAVPRQNGPKSKDTGDNSYVAKRLNMLKQEYIENVGDVDTLIDEKIDSFKETMDVASGNSGSKPTTSSGGSNLIWSFESFDVQDSLKDTLLKSKSRVVMMYPWIRNIDVGILKKFMDTDSRLIIQEAGLDDDASVELIKLLLDNDVEIRTMPHIHTVAAVSDEDEGLIISTDPIYDSFEVGVKYTDPESIKQINNLFEVAWKLSNPIEL